MREGAGIFGELARAKRAHVFDPLYGRAALAGGKFLIAKDSKAFFEAKLKPIAAGNAIAGPVVEIFMSDNAFDPFKIHICGGFGVSQKQG